MRSFQVIYQSFSARCQNNEKKLQILSNLTSFIWAENMNLPRSKHPLIHVNDWISAHIFKVLPVNFNRALFNWKTDVEVIVAALEMASIEDQRNLLRSGKLTVRSAAKSVKQDSLDDMFLKEAKKGNFFLCLVRSYEILNFKALYYLTTIKLQLPFSWTNVISNMIYCVEFQVIL